MPSPGAAQPAAKKPPPKCVQTLLVVPALFMLLAMLVDKGPPAAAPIRETATGAPTAAWFEVPHPDDPADDAAPRPASPVDAAAASAASAADAPADADAGEPEPEPKSEANPAAEPRPPPSAPRDTLAQVELRGRRLLPAWRTRPSWNLDRLLPHWRKLLWADTMGFDSVEQSCAPARESGGPVLTVLSPFGLGSNLVAMADNVIFAAYAGRKFGMVSVADRNYTQLPSTFRAGARGATFTYERLATGKLQAAQRDVLRWLEPNYLQQRFEECSAFAAPSVTVCPSYQRTCAVRPRVCIGPSALAVITGFLQKFAAKQPDLFHALRMHLIREFLRLRFDAHAEVERRARPFTQRDVGVSLVAVHARRGDKLVREAEAAPASEYVDAVAHTGLATPRVAGRAPSAQAHAKPRLRVVVLTDDPDMGRHFNRAWERRDLDPAAVEVVVRVSSARPDAVEDADTAAAALNAAFARQFVKRVKRLAAPPAAVVEANRDAFFETLADMTIMASADAFVGAGSSNFGEVACYLRGGLGCYNAEAGAANAYRWL